jgi:hypothetical protein
VILGAAIIGVVVYVISNHVAPTYSSSAEVAVLVSGTDVNDTTQGADNLASQYAQMVAASPVIAAADAQTRSDIPSSSISGGAVAAQNLIQIQVTASSAAAAQQRAAAVTQAFIKYVGKQVLNQASSYESASKIQLEPLDKQIAAAQSKLADLGGIGTAKAQDIENSLNTLIAERAAALTSIGQTSLAGRPTIALVSNAGPGGQTAPKPKLYALIGFVVSLLLLARLVTYFGVTPVAARAR